jgi:hypothetical protein
MGEAISLHDNETIREIYKREIICPREEAPGEER